MIRPLIVALGLALAGSVQAQVVTQPASIPLNAIDITGGKYGASSAAADNATAIQSAITDAVAAGRPLYIPSQAACFKYTAPLTIAGNLQITGDYSAANWNSGINVPLGTPPLTGSVLCPSSNGSDAIDISGNSAEVNIQNIGIQFQTPFVGTGDGIHYIPTGTNQGLSGAVWLNVNVYGHDGNHYGVNLQNFIYDQFVSVSTYGGGGFNLVGNSASLNFGNSVFSQPYSQVIAGGSAHGISVTANAAQRLNLVTFVRPQVITQNIVGVSPGGTPPTSAQLLWNQDVNVRNIRAIAPDMETTVSSPMQMGSPAHGNDLDWAALFTSSPALNAPSWGSNGVLFGPNTRTLNDTTGTGTIANQAPFAFPGYTQTATSAETVTHLSTLYLGKPTAGTNVTATRNESLYTDGAIYVNNNVTSLGLFDTGNSQINTNAGTGTTEIGDGTTSGQVTIGGANNTTVLGSATLKSGAVTAVSCAANSVVLSTFVVTNGIVTHC